MSVPLIIGLTGGIGSGKTAVSDLFAAKGITVVDADVVARQVVMPDTPALRAIAAHFGSAVLTSDGALNRPLLRQKVFANHADKQWLNALLHPAIRQEMKTQLQAASGPYVILSVPLLVENKLDTMVNRIVVVDCEESLQLSRALSRDGSNEQTIQSIMASQASREERLSKADDVIDNNGNRAALAPQVEKLHQYYQSLGASRSS
ncbi:dephospho-CoA kinase [Aestuariibacter sp. A3R04]|uniref:dephospho-CoA kinase n=1 Tax=Aestuariibacter sp. A3R04 TaxID=2841571 RepID=UPI001C082527|nr:dephospho-CoA kinase [Aestuariibacter sp. A3R04]MBU3021549.1 dephospho-CoA kinase [Aestuariibacter sp. A3R04]